MNKHQQRELDKLMHRNQGRCSICKQHYGEDEVVFTCIGYDKRRKLQTTTKCCHEKLVKVLQLGLCGYVDPEELDDIMKVHPLYDEMRSKKQVPELAEPASNISRKFEV